MQQKTSQESMKEKQQDNQPGMYARQEAWKQLMCIQETGKELGKMYAIKVGRKQSSASASKVGRIQQSVYERMKQRNRQGSTQETQEGNR